MANIEIENNLNTQGFIIWNPLDQDETFEELTGAATYEPGTLLGRVTIGGNLIAYVSTATDGSQFPKFILGNQLVFTGVGTVPFRPLISGQVRTEDLIAFGVGAITAAEADALRDFTIIPRSTQQLAELDNQ